MAGSEASPPDVNPAAATAPAGAGAGPTEHAVLVGWLKAHYPVLVPTLVTFLVCVWGVGVRHLSDDEHCTWWAAQLSFGDFGALLKNIDAVLGLYYGFLRFWIRLFGDSPAALRLPSALAMTVAAGVLSQIGRHLHRPSTGLFAGLFFATIPGISRYAHDARPYAFVVAAVVVSTWALLCAIEQPRSCWRWAAYAVSVALIGALHLVSLSVLFAHAVMMLKGRTTAPWLELQKGLWWRWGIAVALGLLLVIPLVLLGQRQSGQLTEIVPTFDKFLSLPRLLARSKRGGHILLWVALLGLVRPKRYTAALLVWALLPPVLFYSAYDVLHIYRPRYLLFTLPAWSLLAAVTCTEVVKKRRWSVLAATLVLTALVIFSVEPQLALRRATPTRQAPFVAAGFELGEHALAGDAIAYGRPVSGLGHPRISITYATRFSEPLRDIFVRIPANERGLYNAEECEPLASCLPDDVTRLWLVTATSPLGPIASLRPEAARLLGSKFEIRRTWEYASYTLALLTRGTTDSPAPSSDEPAAVGAHDVDADGRGPGEGHGNARDDDDDEGGTP